MTELVYGERPADGPAQGLLVLHHGRGADEQDLIALADVLDPAQRLHVVVPRAPLTLPGWGGYHWYTSAEVGSPPPDSFHQAVGVLGQFHDELWVRTGIPPRQTVLGGFSMGAVMSYATGLSPDRPRPSGILACSGFLPAVAGWVPDFSSRAGLPVLITHGSGDAMIAVSFGREAGEQLQAGGLDVQYVETPGGHQIHTWALRAAITWLAETI
ncbi:MAG: alpha/beta hydrolase [Solirubrobacteraceae bacterium]